MPDGLNVLGDTAALNAYLRHGPRDDVKPALPASEALTVGEVGRRYLKHLERAGRKLATRTAVESCLRIHLEPFFGERAIGSVKHEDVVGLMTLMERKGVGPKSIRSRSATTSARCRRSTASRCTRGAGGRRSTRATAWSCPQCPITRASATWS